MRHGPTHTFDTNVHHLLSLSRKELPRLLPLPLLRHAILGRQVGRDEPGVGDRPLERGEEEAQVLPGLAIRLPRAVSHVGQLADVATTAHRLMVHHQVARLAGCAQMQDEPLRLCKI
jgi:hypothetical protein